MSILSAAAKFGFMIMCRISNKKVESEVFYFVFFCFNYTIYIISMSTIEGIYFTATAFTFKKYIRFTNNSAQ